jgi:hypothetical protein
MKTKFALLLVLVAMFAVGISVAQDGDVEPGPQDFTSEGSINRFGYGGALLGAAQIGAISGGSGVVEEQADGDDVAYISGLEGIPANGADALLGAYDLTGNTVWTLKSTVVAFGVACLDVVVYKVSNLGSAGPFSNYECGTDNRLTIYNNTGTGTFLLFDGDEL